MFYKCNYYISCLKVTLAVKFKPYRNMLQLQFFQIAC